MTQTQTRPHITAAVQASIRAAGYAGDHDRVALLVASAARVLAAHLDAGEIGMEWFSSEMRAVLIAARW